MFHTVSFVTNGFFDGHISINIIVLKQFQKRELIITATVSCSRVFDFAKEVS